MALANAFLFRQGRDCRRVPLARDCSRQAPCSGFPESHMPSAHAVRPFHRRERAGVSPDRIIRLCHARQSGLLGGKRHLCMPLPITTSRAKHIPMVR
jgi:hypothetical protein